MSEVLPAGSAVRAMTPPLPCPACGVDLQQRQHLETCPKAKPRPNGVVK